MVNLDDFYARYGKTRVTEALELLNYKKVSIMPKSEIQGRPTLYIFRHGQTEDNADYLFSGWRDPELTEKGKAQALTLADKLQNKKIDILYSSPQKRAVETLKIAISKNASAINLPINVDERIKERSYGDLQGKSKLKMQLEQADLLRLYRRSYDKKASGGESLEDVVKRVFSFCQDVIPYLKEQKLSAAISCHGNSIRGFRKYFENLSIEEVCDLETPLAQDYLAYSL